MALLGGGGYAEYVAVDERLIMRVCIYIYIFSYVAIIICVFFKGGWVEVGGCQGLILCV